MTTPASQYTLAEAIGVFLAWCERFDTRLRELASRTVPMGEIGPAGEAGPQGPQGPAGDRGERGERGLPGADARPWRHWRAYDPARNYQAGDVVAHDGGSWVALQDAPGALPGDGWAQLAMRGQRGKPGDRGERGPAGPQGRGIVRMYSDESTRALMVEYSDGTQEAFAVETL